MIENKRAEIGTSIRRRLEAHDKALTLIKGVAILGGALVASLAQFMGIGDLPLSNWQTAGIVGTAFVFLGGLYVLRTDNSAAQELERARQAIELAVDAQRDAERAQMYSEWRSGDFQGFESDARKARELYLSMHAMRSALERFDFAADDAEDHIGKALLTAASQHIPVALGFEMEHQWTYGIYRAHNNGEGAELILSAERRAIECDPAKARKWPSGSGYVGTAYRTRQEIIIDDSRSSLVKTLFSVGELARNGDDDRYVSIVAVPILVGAGNDAWGVAIATSNQEGHFSVNEEPGVHASEAVRAMAGMAALGASIARRHKAAANSVEAGKDGG